MLQRSRENAISKCVKTGNGESRGKDQKHGSGKKKDKYVKFSNIYYSGAQCVGNVILMVSLNKKKRK